MNHFVGLPWRIASLAGLLVGGISLLYGVGPWTCLLRVAVAFAVFGAAGFGLQFALQAEPPPGQEAMRQGRHFDPATPGESADEPAPPTSDTH